MSVSYTHDDIAEFRRRLSQWEYVLVYNVVHAAAAAVIAARASALRGWRLLPESTAEKWARRGCVASSRFPVAGVSGGPRTPFPVAPLSEIGDVQPAKEWERADRIGAEETIIDVDAIEAAP